MIKVFIESLYHFKANIYNILLSNLKLNIQVSHVESIKKKSLESYRLTYKVKFTYVRRFGTIEMSTKKYS